MKRRWVALCAVILVGLLAWTYFAGRNADASGLGDDFDAWSPTPVALRQEAGTNGTDPRTKAGQTVRDRFADLFKKRFRRHDPPVAVGMRFANNTVILLCPARMEPWNMDRLAVDAWHETQTAFGHPFDVDIYITYIGGPPVKVGELRPAPGHPDRVVISYTHKNILGACTVQSAPILLSATGQGS